MYTHCSLMCTQDKYLQLVTSSWYTYFLGIPTRIHKCAYCTYEETNPLLCFQICVQLNMASYYMYFIPIVKN